MGAGSAWRRPKVHLRDSEIGIAPNDDDAQVASVPPILVFVFYGFNVLLRFKHSIYAIVGVCRF